MKSIGYAWAGALLGCCALSTQAFAQHAAVTITDVSGNAVSGAAINFRAAGADFEKVDYLGSTVILQDVGEKVDLNVVHPTYGSHNLGVDLKGDGKYYVDIILTGDDMLAKVRPATTIETSYGHGLKGMAPVGVNGSNSCASASAIGNGVFAFDNTGATTDGVSDALCLAFGQNNITNDIWYLYTADCDGNATIDTCAGPTDTRLAAYSAGACPTGGGIIVCNDDFCGLQSSITFPVTNGSSYLVRVGNFPGASAGAGTLTVSCSMGGGGGGDCTAATFCQNPDLATGFTSNDVGSIFTVADNFSATANGDITDVCFWGVGFDGFGDCSGIMSDNFTITYYNDDGNGVCPGSLKAGPFNVTAARSATGNLLLGVFTELQWAASHAPVSVTAGECCWIEVKNSDTACFFAWESSQAGDGRNCQTDITVGQGASTGSDQAFCLNVDFDNTNCDITGPANDLCADAEAIAGQGVFAYDNTGAGTDGPAHAVCDFFTDGGNTDNDIWYCWTADCTGDVRWETCGINVTDSKLNVYDGCGTATDANLIACNDDDCGLQSGLIFQAVSGNTYKLRVGNFPTETPGAGSFSLACVEVPSNDLCQDAISIAVPSTTSGSTSFATLDAGAPNCGTSVTAPGVWYTVSGTGNTMTVNTCQNPQTDTKLSVYCGSCDPLAGLTCVGANDDACSFQSEVTWCSQSGAEYLILVHGFGTATGGFDLAVFDNGTSCTGAVQCQTAGACCTGPMQETCVEVTPDECAMLGGSYQGDNTACAGYSASACVNAFQDISGTGTNTGLFSDDAGVNVAIGFDFTFFGVSHNTINVTSNGYLTFGGTLGDFTETNIPDPTTPNDIICPLWADFSPNISGNIYTQTTGPVGNRVFITQWDNVPQFSIGGSNTFQSLLFEADNSIEFRYGAIDITGTGPDDGTVGIENATGMEGVQWASGVGAGDCVRFDLNLACPPPECHLVFATGMGNDTFNQGGHTWNTQLDGVISTYEVWLDDVPQFQIPPFTNFPVRWGNIRNMAMLDVPFQTYAVQVVMWNPEVFPANPEQYSNVMNVTVWLSGRVDVSYAGTNDNMQVYTQVIHDGGYNFVRFPFSIDGF